MWRQAVLKLLIDDTVQLVGMGGLLLLSALLGASLGSIGRWFGARWQCGMIAGLWISCDAVLLGEWHGYPLFSRAQLEIWIGAALLGLLAAMVASICAAIWFARTESYWARYFRDHPWHWTGTRFIRVMAVCVGLLIAPIWFVARTPRIRVYEEILTMQQRLLPVSERWGPYDAYVWPWDGPPEEGLKLTVRSPAGLSAEALKFLDDGPWPYVRLEVHVTDTVRDTDLINAAPALITIKRIDLFRCSLTDECLPALVQCPQLQELMLRECPLITPAGAQQFKNLRTDVAVTMIRNNRVVTFTAK